MPKARREYLATDDGHQESLEKLTQFLQWLPTSRPEYANLRDEPELNVPDERTRHYAYDDRFIVLLGDAWNNSTVAGPTTERLAAAIHTLNLSRSDAANDLRRRLKLIDDKDRMKAFNKGDYSESSVTIREMARTN